MAKRSAPADADMALVVASPASPKAFQVEAAALGAVDLGAVALGTVTGALAALAEVLVAAVLRHSAQPSA